MWGSQTRRIQWQFESINYQIHQRMWQTRSDLFMKFPASHFLLNSKIITKCNSCIHLKIELHESLFSFQSKTGTWTMRKYSSKNLLAGKWPHLIKIISWRKKEKKKKFVEQNQFMLNGRIISIPAWPIRMWGQNEIRWNDKRRDNSRKSKQKETRNRNQSAVQATMNLKIICLSFSNVEPIAFRWWLAAERFHSSSAKPEVFFPFVLMKFRTN